MSFTATREALASDINLYRLGVKALGYGLWISASRNMLQLTWGSLS